MRILICSFLPLVMVGSGCSISQFDYKNSAYVKERSAQIDRRIKEDDEKRAKEAADRARIDRKLDEIYSDENLKLFENRSRESISPMNGVKVFADRFTFNGESKSSGTARGHVLVELTPEFSPEPIVRKVYGGEVIFGSPKSKVVIAELPQAQSLLGSRTAIIATDSATTMTIMSSNEFKCHGPSRTMALDNANKAHAE